MDELTVSSDTGPQRGCREGETTCQTTTITETSGRVGPFTSPELASRHTFTATETEYDFTFTVERNYRPELAPWAPKSDSATVIVRDGERENFPFGARCIGERWSNTEFEGDLSTREDEDYGFCVRVTQICNFESIPLTISSTDGSLPPTHIGTAGDCVSVSGVRAAVDFIAVLDSPLVGVGGRCTTLEDEERVIRPDRQPRINVQFAYECDTSLPGCGPGG